MFVFVFSVVVCTFFAYLWFKKQNNYKRLPPGPMRLPILGSAIQLYRANPRYPHLAMAKLADKYGDIMCFGFGIHTAVVVSSFEIMKEVFKLSETNSQRFEFPYISDRNYGKNLGIIWGYGQVWNDVRRFTKKILKNFGYGKVEIMNQSLNESANQLIDCIKMESLSSDGTYLVQSKKFAIHVVNVLWNLVGGYKFDPDDELVKRNLECSEKGLEIIGHGNPYNMFPFLKTWFPAHVRYPEHLKIHKEIHDFTNSLINDAIEKRNQRLESEPISFIEVFLDEIEKNHGNPDTIFTHEQLQIILEDLFIGGSETTGTLLSWSILYLVQNPDVQLKLRREIFGRMEKSLQNHTGTLSSFELKKIPYLKATVLEIMRLGNISPIPAPRCSTEDIEIRNYEIPKGTVLFYNLYPMFKDKSYWKDPDTFTPDRFLTDFGEIDQTQAERIMNSVFGVGARICFGETIAVDTLYTFLAAMTMNFEFNSIRGKEPSVENPDAGICVCPRTFCVRVTPASI